MWDESVNVETITVVPAASSTAKVEISEAAKVESITVDSSAESATAEIKVAENVTVPNFDVVGDGDVVIDNSGEIGLSGMKIDTAAKLLIALQIGGTVDLAGDITTSQQLIVKENISVTLNLHGVLAADGGKMIVNGGNYLLGNGSAGSCYRMAYTSDYGVIEINAGTFTRNVDNNNAFFGAYFAHSEDSENIIINASVVHMGSLYCFHQKSGILRSSIYFFRFGCLR